MAKPDGTGNVADPTGGTTPPNAAQPSKEARDVAVTYLGPTDPRDRTTVVSVPGHSDRFRRDEVVTTTKSIAARLNDMAGHSFHTEPAKPEGDTSDGHR